MDMERLESIDEVASSPKLAKAYEKMQALIEVLGKRDIPTDILTFIDARIKLINSFSGSDKARTKMLKSNYTQILKYIKEKLALVPKNHYLSLWMVFGMLGGVVISSALSGTGFMGMAQGMGISMGMLIGIIIGTNLDKQAEKNGNQLEL